MQRSAMRFPCFVADGRIISASSAHKFVDLALCETDAIKIIGFCQYSKRM
jgi:hypothetical protein